MNRKVFIILFNLIIIAIGASLIYDQVILFWSLLLALEVVNAVRRRYIGLSMIPKSFQDFKDSFFLRFSAP